ncbi:MAG: PLP-dependent aminotransferase family protein [Pseudomonadota bacterium]
MALPLTGFHLDARAGGTLQQQVQETVASGILEGRFRPGDRMPSSRELAKHLGVSRITITLAYTELVSAGYLTSRARSGYFVSETAPDASVASPETANGDGVDWSRVIRRRYSGETLVDKPADWHAYPYPFLYGQADKTLFDHTNWRRCAMRALGRRDLAPATEDLFERDDPVLIEYIVRHILARRGIAARQEDVLITLGAQNALWLIVEILLAGRRTVAIENPIYPGLRAILNSTASSLIPVDVDDEGLPPEKVPAETDVVFVTPSHHSPTTATMPLHRRRALLDRAEAEDFVIVEDDYEFEIAAAAAPSRALKSLDRDGRVIYVGSFSKSIFPGLRLGYIVASPPFLREARALRTLVLRHPPGQLQRTAAYFLSLGHYDALVKRMDAHYRRRREAMREAFHRNGLRVASEAMGGGSSFWMRAPDGIDTGALAQRLKEDGVLVDPGAPFFADPSDGVGYYRLAYSSIRTEDIEPGVALIARAIAGMEREPPR